MALWKFNDTITAEGLRDTSGSTMDLTDTTYQIKVSSVFGGINNQEYNDVFIYPGFDYGIQVIIVDNNHEQLDVVYGTFDNEIIFNYLTNQTFDITSIGENVRPWLEANATCLEEAPTGEYLEITYNGKTYTISAGQKITFKGGKTMQGDIAVKVVQGEEEEPEEKYYIASGVHYAKSFNANTGYGLYNMLDHEADISFTSNNKSYSKMRIENLSGFQHFYYDTTNVYAFNGDQWYWTNTAYKHIQITADTEVSKEFYDDFYAIFEKISGSGGSD